MYETYSLPLLITLGAGLLLTGALAGVLAGLLGVGGGIVIVPVLFYLFEILGLPETASMHVAVATSLATIIPTSISSARSHYKRGNLDFALFKRWAPLILVGAALGGFSARYFNGDHLTAIFGSVALLVAVNMALPSKLVLAGDLPRSPISNGAIGTVIGFFSSLMGIGGGTLSVPALTLFSQPVLRAVGTASAFGLVIAVPAVIGFIIAGLSAKGRPPFSLGYVNVPAAFLIFSATIFTAPLGARIASAINARALKLAFAAFLFLTAIRMLWKVFV